MSTPFLTSQPISARPAPYHPCGERDSDTMYTMTPANDRQTKHIPQNMLVYCWWRRLESIGNENRFALWLVYFAYLSSL
ncbi:hypothetical protein N7504_007025 [Penicillium tannophilum]|nr:hypothetical protein N7504_007025 [Penicillium tannophilum]